MIPELGQFSLILALCLSIVLATVPIIGAARNNLLWMNLARPLAAGVFVFVGLGMAILVYAFVTDDFSVQFVAQHSNTLLPIQYKFTASWGGHEGSFLLWTFMFTSWMLAVAIFSKSMPIDFISRVLGVLGILAVAYLLFMLVTSNPFARIIPLAPADGADLNPQLQDFAFIIHPPMLYMGYVGFSVVFGFAIAALLSGRLDAAWARWSRPWANAAWVMLTLGIALGSWWAYYELGWGGWWAWDPVENPPLMGWLFGAALIHSLAVTEKRGVFKSWTVLLAILAFSCSLFGTFITRSGLLTSVHAFATDPSRGIFILGILALAVGGSLLLFAFRAHHMRSEFGFGLLSREILLLVNNVILVVASASVFLGTVFPMVYQAVTGGDLISIGPPYFNAIFVPLMALLAVLMGVGPICRWKKTSTQYLLKQLSLVAAASVVLGVVLPLLVISRFSLSATIAVTLVAWILLTMLKDLANKTANKPNRWLGLKSLTISYYGMLLAHFGVAVMILGVAFTSNFSSERGVLLSPGESTELAGYSFEFQGSNELDGPNYFANQGHFIVRKDGRVIDDLHPQRRVYLASGTPSTEMAIHSTLMRDLFITLGDPKEGESWSMTIYVKPFIRWVWLGAIFMALGGTIAAVDKRYRRRLKRPSTVDKKTSKSSKGTAGDLQPTS